MSRHTVGVIIRIITGTSMVMAGTMALQVVMRLAGVI